MEHRAGIAAAQTEDDEASEVAAFQVDHLVIEVAVGRTEQKSI